MVRNVAENEGENLLMQLGASKWRTERTDSRWYKMRYTKEEDSADLNLVENSSLCKTMKFQVSGIFKALLKKE